MKKVLMATVAMFAFSSAAIAGGIEVTETEVVLEAFPQIVTSPVVGGSIDLEFAENADGEFAATTTFAAGIVTPGLAFGEIGVESVDGNTFEINKWYFGALFGSSGTVSFGDHDGGVFVEAYSDYSTVATPAIAEALIVTAGDSQVALGFTDITNDITDVSNIQAAYTIDTGVSLTTVSVDYNFDTEEFVVGSRTSDVELGPVSLGSTVSYASASEVIAYEIDATMSYGLTAYVNGDNDDAFRNVGAGYVRDINNLTVFADVNYDLNAEEFTPKAGISFNF